MSLGSTVIFESGVIIPMPQLNANSPACSGVKLISVVLRVREQFADSQSRRHEEAPARRGLARIDPPLHRHTLLDREAVRLIVEPNDSHADALRLACRRLSVT